MWRGGAGAVLVCWTFPPEHFVLAGGVLSKRGDTFWEFPLELDKQWAGLLVDAAVKEPGVRVVGEQSTDHVRGPAAPLEFVRHAYSLEFDRISLLVNNELEIGLRLQVAAGRAACSGPTQRWFHAQPRVVTGKLIVVTGKG